MVSYDYREAAKVARPAYYVQLEKEYSNALDVAVSALDRAKKAKYERGGISTKGLSALTSALRSMGEALRKAGQPDIADAVLKASQKLQSATLKKVREEKTDKTAAKPKPQHPDILD